MADRKTQISELAELMGDFGLTEAKLTLGDLTIGYKKRGSKKPEVASPEGHEHEAEFESFELSDPVDETPVGEPIASPMTGIYYSTPSPTAPPFVTEGAEIEEGQIVGLIEAMKVFNEIPAPRAGIVLKVLVVNGALVQIGETLMYIS